MWRLLLLPEPIAVAEIKIHERPWRCRGHQSRRLPGVGQNSPSLPAALIRGISWRVI